MELLPLQTQQQQVTLDQAINAWLDTKAGRTKSAHTRRSYETTIYAFREVLRRFGLDLDSEPRLVSVAAQGWAAQGINGGEVSNNTFNQRLAALASFYEFARKKQLLDIANPIEMTDRKPVQAFSAAVALSENQVKEKLKAIPRTSREGMRDYALLSIAFSTGRRISEIAGMRWGHLRIEGRKVVVTFPHCKGGKVMSDELGPKTAEAIMSYLHMVYGAELGMLPQNAPVWVSFARNSSKGGAISNQAISDIAKKRLGTGKFHTTRHTFTVSMDHAGASLDEIGHRLGHSNLQTTSIYLKQLHAAENKYAPAVEILLGIDE